MTKNYNDFLNIVNRKIDLYKHIPERHLSIEGRGVYELYKAVDFLTGFTSNATEMLEMLNDDEGVEAAAQFAGSELRKIRRYLENLAAAENVQPARKENTAGETE